MALAIRVDAIGKVLLETKPRPEGLRKVSNAGFPHACAMYRAARQRTLEKDMIRVHINQHGAIVSVVSGEVGEARTLDDLEAEGFRVDGKPTSTGEGQVMLYELKPLPGPGVVLLGPKRYQPTGMEAHYALMGRSVMPPRPYPSAADDRPFAGGALSNRRPDGGQVGNPNRPIDRDRRRD